MVGVENDSKNRSFDVLEVVGDMDGYGPRQISYNIIGHGLGFHQSIRCTTPWSQCPSSPEKYISEF